MTEEERRLTHQRNGWLFGIFLQLLIINFALIQIYAKMGS